MDKVQAYINRYQATGNTEYLGRALMLLRPAIAQVVTRYSNQLDVNDKTSDVIEKLYLKATIYKSSQGLFVTWAMRVARNELVDMLRRNKVAYCSLDWYPIIEEETTNENMHEKLYAAIDQLPETRRKIMRLHIMRKMRLNDVATTLNMNYNTVRIHVMRARKEIIQLLKSA